MDKKVADSPMATALTGSQRRKRILTMMRQSSRPLSGGALGRDTGVSRQVVVQDIALLRTEGYPIIATARGYISVSYTHLNILILFFWLCFCTNS